MTGIIRWEVVNPKACWGESALDDFVKCKNDLAIFVISSKFVFSPFTVDSKHIEED